MDFTRYGLIENKCRVYFNDEVHACNHPILFFANPVVSYAYDSLQKRRSGYWCIFTNEFLRTNDPYGIIAAFPAMEPAYAAIIFPEPEQLAVIKWLFQQLTNTIKAEFTYRNEMAFIYIQLLMLEGMKAACKSMPAPTWEAAVRITRQFLQLREKQFPIQSPDRPMQFSKAGDFAGLPAIHINHQTSG